MPKKHKARVKPGGKQLPDETEAPQQTANLIVVSDTHCGCQLGLCPAGGVRLDEGGQYRPSLPQRKVWGYWQDFWTDWVPKTARGEPFAIVLNGDAIDGKHHGSTHQIADNLEDQAEIAYEVLAPIVELCDGRYYHIRGTEAHTGPSGVQEERLAKRLGAIPSELGHRARYELWARLGRGLVHIAHHIGTTGSSQYESTAVHKELVDSYVEAGRSGEEPPNVVCRSHRHRMIETRVPSRLGYGISFVTSGWQLKTPFVFRLAGGRLSTPQFGGSLIRQGDEDLYTRHKHWEIDRPKEVVI